MTVNYGKTQLKKCMYSAIFLTILLGSITVLLIKDKSIAVLMVCTPIVLYFEVRSIALIFRILKRIKRHSIFLKCNDEEIYIYSIDGERECINRSQIKYLMWDTGKMYIQTETMEQQYKNSKLRKFLRYYLESNTNKLISPLWCESEELKKFCAYVGIEHKKKVEINVNDYVNLCSRYVVILVGICMFFLWTTISGQNLKIAIIVLVIHGIIQMILHKKDTVSLCVDKVNFGLILRCVMCSAFLAQYIFVACKVEELFMNNDILGACSVNTVILSIVVYLFFGLLFMPQKGFGRRMTYYMVRRSQNKLYNM